MAGLLDNYGTDPLGQGLLALGATMMTPRAMGGGIGPGLLAFNQGAMGAQQYRRALEQDARRNKLTDAQIKNFESDAMYRDAQIKATQDKLAFDQEQALGRQVALADFMDSYQQAGGKWSPELSMKAMRAGIKGEDLERLAKGAALGRQPLTWQGGVGRDPITGEAVAAAPDVNKPFFPSLVNGEVQAQPNQALQNFEVGKAKAGATNIGMPRIEVKMGDSVGSQVGPMLKDSKVATQGAVNMADAASRVLDALDKGGVIAGPGASLRLRGAQVASMLGIGGKDAVAQTRQVIRALAESSVEARKELQGQGQVTENEAKAVQKAMSGDIDDLTVDEIRDIAKLNLRAAAFRVQQHQQQLEAMPESLRTARPFYEVPRAGDVLKVDPKRYAIQQPTGASIAPDGRSASGRIGQPTVDELLRKYGGQ